MTVSLRRAEKSDYPACVALLQILKGAGGEPFDCKALFTDIVTDGRGRIIVAEEVSEGEGSTTLLGMVTVSYNLALRYQGEYCQLEELIVVPEARGKHVGGLLVAQIVADAKARGCGELGLYLVESTEHNRPFYEKYGFKAVGTEMRQAL
jgi:GNAT superfamily N-acetyltransferase